MMKKNHIGFLLFLIIAVVHLGCGRTKCNRELMNFDSQSPPLIVIDSVTADCRLHFRGTFWLNGGVIAADGELEDTQDGVYLTSAALSKGKVKYFDFTQPLRKTYSIQFDLPNGALVQKARIDSTVMTPESGLVYIFRVNEAFELDDRNEDLVFFVSRAKGIIGSYISANENGVDMILSPRGDILRSHMNYSRKEFKKIL
jgi:hypothetical protein